MLSTIMGARTVSDFQLVIKIFAGIFIACAMSAIAVLALNAWSPQPLADFLVHRLGGIMLSFATGIVGLFAGQRIESQKHKPIDGRKHKPKR
jgi:hypothetical protein